MSTKQIMFSLLILVVALVVYQYFGQGDLLTLSGFGLKRRESSTPIANTFVKQPRTEKEAAVVGEIDIKEKRLDMVVITLNAKSKLGEVTEMVVWTNTNTVSDWEKYEAEYTVETNNNTNRIYVKFRDSEKYESVTYSLQVNQQG